jgi:hypothetical protein
MAPAVPETARRGGESNPAQTIVQWIENLTKIGVFFAIFGYLSLRAHFNTIGLSVGSLEIQRYLQELAEIAGTMSLAVVWLTPVLIVGWLLFVLLGRLLPRWDSPALGRWASGLVAPLMMAAVLMIVCRILLATDALTGRFDIAVGYLSKGDSGRGSETLFFVVFYIWAAGLAISTALGRLARKRESRYARWWLVPLGITGILAFQLTLIYGRTLHSSEFPRIQVVTAGTANAPAPSCGLLLLESTSALHIWTVRNNLGLIEVVPRSEIKQVLTGSSADLWAMVNLAEQKRTVPLCPVL